MKFRYEIYMPAGHEDFISHKTPLAACDEEIDMLHYVNFYHFRRADSIFFPAVEGPIYVKEGR